MPGDKETIEQFAARIKAKYPDYKDVNDTDLVNRIISKHPEYKDSVDFGTGQPVAKTQAQTAPSFAAIPDVYHLQGPTAEEKQRESVSAAQERIGNELNNIGPTVKSYLTKQKRDQEMANIQSRMQQTGSDATRNTALQQRLAMSFPSPATYVSPQEIEDYKSHLNNDEDATIDILREHGKLNPQKDKQIRADLYAIKSQDRSHNAGKIAENIENIKKGEIQYNPRTDQLRKEEGFLGSLGTSYNQRLKDRDEYDFFQTASKEQIKDKLETEYKSYDPDEPQNIPNGIGGHLGGMIGSQPPQALLAGIGVGMVPGAQEAAPWAAALVASPEIHGIGYVHSLKSNYAQLRQQGVSPEDATNRAQNRADFDANVDMAQGALMTVAETRLGLNAGKINLTQGFVKTVANATKDAVKATAREALPQGAIAAGLQGAKNLYSGKPLGEGMSETAAQTMAMVAGIGLLLKTPKALAESPKLLNRVKTGLANNPEVVNEQLAGMVKSGDITPNEANQVHEQLQQHTEQEARIPDTITDEGVRDKLRNRFQKYDQLKAELETVHESMHPQRKEQLKALEEDIAGLEKEGVEKSKVAEKEKQPLPSEKATLLLDEGLEKPEGEKGHIGEEYEEFRDHPEHLMAFINEELNQGKETEMRQEFGDGLVDLSKENNPHTSSYAGIKNIKPKESATTEQSAGTLDVGQSPPNGSALGEGNAGSEIPPGESGPEAKGKNQGQEIVNPPEGADMTGITHAQMDATAKEFGLTTYQEAPEKIPTWDKQADERFAKDPQAMDKLLTKMRNGEQPDAVEQRMMIKYIADLKAKIRANPSDELLTQLKRAKDLSNIVGGRDVAKSLRARQGEVPVEEQDVADFMIRKMDANGVSKLTEEQKQSATNNHEEVSATKNLYDEKIAKLEAENAKLKAAKAVKKAAEAKNKTASKKGNRDYKKEIDDVWSDLKKHWDEGKGQLSATIIPYADRLVKIAPDVLKLMKIYVEKGVTELSEIVKNIHERAKEGIPEVTEKDIHDIIAGEYKTPRPTRNELMAKVKDLRDEAELINRLEELENGEVPKNEKSKVKRNQKIEELKKKIKEHNETKLAAHKANLERQRKKLEEKIQKGDFEPEVPKEPLKLDKEATDLRDRYLKAKEDWEIELMKDEYGKRGAWEKIGRGVSEVVGIGRVVKSSFDVSMPLRQGLWGLSRELLSNPFKGGGFFKPQKQLASQFGRMYRALASEKVSRRIMADIHESPRYEMAQEAGLKIAEPTSKLSEAREETYGPSWAERVPFIGKSIPLEKGKNAPRIGGLVKASERAATTFVNTMKWDIFNNFVDMFQKQGKTFENARDLYEAAAVYANQTVGRGKLGESVERANQVTSKVFFSLRLQASRLQLMTYLVNPKFYAKIPKEIKIAYLKDMAKFVALGTATLALAHAAGLKVGVNPYASNFGKIQVGDTEYDIWGGFSQWAVLMSRLIGGKTTDAGGHMKEVGPESGQKNRGDIALRFIRSKVSPELGTGINIFTGKDYLGKRTDIKTEAVNFINPLITQDIYQVAKDGSVQQAFITAILAAHGMGVQTYDHSEKAAPTTGGKKGGHKKEHRK